MAFTIKYFPLFEIRILHEYFLLHEENLTYFDLSQNEQQQILEKRISMGQYKVMQHLSIQPTEECSALLKNQRLKIRQTATGIVVACAAKTINLSDNTKILVPEIPISPKTEFTFNIKVLNPYFRNYSLLPLKFNSNANYLFTNFRERILQTEFLTLSKPVTEFQSGKVYYTGDVADHGGVLKTAYANTDSNLFWDNMAGKGYLNENDRRLFPNIFMYYPSEFEKKSSLSFTLKSIIDNTEIKKITFPASGKSSVHVDFSNIQINGINLPLPRGRYILEKDNSVSVEEKEIYLVSRFSSKDSGLSAGDLGMILIQAGDDDKVYRILGENSTILQPHPIFQIRLASRSTFWRYQAKFSTKNLRPHSDNASFFMDDLDNNIVASEAYKFLITKKPQKLAHLPVHVINGIGATEVFPQPDPTPIRTKPGDTIPGRIYSDIYISTVSNDKINIV